MTCLYMLMFNILFIVYFVMLNLLCCNCFDIIVYSWTTLVLLGVLLVYDCLYFLSIVMFSSNHSLSNLVLICSVLHNINLFIKYGVIILIIFEFFLLFCEYNINIIIFNTYFINVGILCLYNYVLSLLFFNHQKFM